MFFVSEHKLHTSIKYRISLVLQPQLRDRDKPADYLVMIIFGADYIPFIIIIDKHCIICNKLLRMCCKNLLGGLEVKMY